MAVMAVALVVKVWKMAGATSFLLSGRKRQDYPGSPWLLSSFFFSRPFLKSQATWSTSSSSSSSCSGRSAGRSGRGASLSPWAPSWSPIFSLKMADDPSSHGIWFGQLRNRMDTYSSIIRGSPNPFSFRASSIVSWVPFSGRSSASFPAWGRRQPLPFFCPSPFTGYRFRHHHACREFTMGPSTEAQRPPFWSMSPESHHAWSLASTGMPWPSRGGPVRPSGWQPSVRLSPGPSASLS